MDKYPIKTEEFFKSLDFSWAYNRVVTWNALARNNQHVFDEDTIDLQVKLVKEETKELFDAIGEKDKVETLDALCDMFVVGAYWYFLQNNGKPKGFFANEIGIDVDHLLAVKFDIEQNSSFLFLMDTCKLLNKFEGNVRGALTEVMNSNDSKFPLVKKDPQNGLESICIPTETDPFYYTPEEMCEWIEAHRGYKGITHKVIKDSEKKKRYVFLDENGKIMKPFSFFSPDLRKFC